MRPKEVDDQDWFPFREGDQVEVTYPDVLWDDAGNEYTLGAGWRGTVMQVCWDRDWTTHVWVNFAETGTVCVGWDVIKLVKRLRQS